MLHPHREQMKLLAVCRQAVRDTIDWMLADALHSHHPTIAALHCWRAIDAEAPFHSLWLVRLGCKHFIVSHTQGQTFCPRCNLLDGTGHFARNICINHITEPSNRYNLSNFVALGPCTFLILDMARTKLPEPFRRALPDKIDLMAADTLRYNHPRNSLTRQLHCYMCGFLYL